MTSTITARYAAESDAITVAVGSADFNLLPDEAQALRNALDVALGERRENGAYGLQPGDKVRVLTADLDGIERGAIRTVNRILPGVPFPIYLDDAPSADYPVRPDEVEKIVEEDVEVVAQEDEATETGFSVVLDEDEDEAAEEEADPYDAATAAMNKALFTVIYGLPISIDEDAKVWHSEAVQDEFGETGPAYCDSGEGYIVTWEEAADALGTDPRYWYDGARNFPVKVKANDGGEDYYQVVRMEDCHPLDDEAAERLRSAVLKVGGGFAEARGIVPGAKVAIPPTSLAAILSGGVGKVVAVEGGMAQVDVALGPTLDIPAFLLFRIPDEEE